MKSKQYLFEFYQEIPKLLREFEEYISRDEIILFRKVSFDMIKLIEDTTEKVMKDFKKMLKGES